jgi:phage shock protein PspC (stress-responsive transcriptional regulator)
MNGKRLTKSYNKVIAGVCGGIADYTGVKASTVRLLTVIGVVFFGLSIFAYIVAAVFMPAPEGSRPRF